MEVILKEDVEKLGHRGDIVKVAEGFGRNFLLPRKLAIEASKANKAVIEQMKAAAVRKSAKEKTGAEALAEQLNDVQLTFERKTGEKDHLFGSVTSSDVATALEAKGFKIDRRKVHLDDPLKSLGEFHVPVKLHRDVTAHIKVTVNREGGEAGVSVWLRRSMLRLYRTKKAVPKRDGQLLLVARTFTADSPEVTSACQYQA